MGKPEKVLENLDFLRGGGEMGERIRAYDWENSPLGHPRHWSLPLRTSVRLLLTTNHPVFLFWGPRHICFYNDAYSRSLGTEKHPVMLGKAGREAWDEIWDRIGPQIDYVMAGRGSTWHENHLLPITRHGRQEDVYWTYSYSPLHDPQAASGVGGVLVLCTETTSQVQAAQRMRAAEERWRQLFDQAPGFICVLNGPEHVFEFANPAYFEVVNARDIIGKPAREALPWAIEQGFIERLDRVYRSGKPLVAKAAKIVLPGKGDGGGTRYIDFVYQPIRDEEGRISGIFAQGSDVTERVLAENALQEADRRKNDFLATLAHELRNPLAPIQSGIELLGLKGDDPLMAKRLLGMMAGQISHLVRLVDDLMDVTRISRGKISLKLEPVDLKATIQRALDSRGQIDSDKRQVSVELPAGDFPVKGDQVRLVQVFSNLLDNAGKYTREGGHIDISLRREGDQAVVSVRDDGIGIPAEMLDKLFQMFVQVPGAGGGGLGIGLSLVRDLVQLHGGSVEACSEGPGRGSEFLVRLPLLEGAGTAPLPEREGDDQEIAGKRVLVVDDNQDAADSIASLLQLLGAEVSAVHSGEAALAACRDFRPQLILLDIGLPDIDGYEVARRLHADPGLRGTRIVAVTGWGQDQDRERSRGAGFHYHLVKPVSLAVIRKIVASLD